jgi:hypothetical protein
MAVTTIFSGNLAHQTASAWVAVPAANLYTLQVFGCPIDYVEFSVDGTHPFKANSSNSSGYGEPSILTRAMAIKSPVAWARLNNTDTGDLTGVVATILNV